MIERLYVNNFRCFENFSIDFVDRPSALIIGKNGSGKSTLRQAFGVLQKICRGPNRVKHWIDGSDFTQHRKHIPMRFEVELTLMDKRFQYAISFEFPDDLREARVTDERLSVDGNVVFLRQLSQVKLAGGSTFGLDWHVAALPVIFERPGDISIRQIRSFFASMILIAPLPAQMSGFSEEESFELQEHAENFSDWLNAVLARYPAAYNVLYDYLKYAMSDLASFENPPRGEKGKQLLVKFEKEGFDQVLSVDFKQLSDGEKCFFLSALIVASNKFGGPVFCMWDEPDTHLALPEVGHFITQLRKITNQKGQLIATSHNPEVIRRFSDENTFIFMRKSHLEPTVVRTLADFQYSGDLIETLVRDEIIG